MYPFSAGQSSDWSTEAPRLVLECIDRYCLDYWAEVYVDDRSPRDDEQVVHRVDLVDNDQSGLVNEICRDHSDVDLQ